MNFINTINSQIEKIYDKNTKNYFIEVFNCYKKGCYRASCVMLYTAIIFDILKKLEELYNVFDQDWAGKLLHSLDDKRMKESVQTQWENDLIKELKTQKDFINSDTIARIEQIKSYRNLSAHPVLNNNNLLTEIGKNEIEPLIEYMLLNLFIQPAMFTNKITEYMTEYVSKYFYMEEYDSEKIEPIKEFLKKMCVRLNDKVYCRLTRDFWKIVFKADDENCNKNKLTNFIVLVRLIIWRTEYLQDDFKQHSSQLNLIKLDDFTMDCICRLIKNIDFIYDIFNSENKMKINEYVGQHKNYKIELIKLYNSYDDYILYIKNNSECWEQYDSLKWVYKKAKDEDRLKLREMFCYIYINSKSFNAADKSFKFLICDYSKDYSKEEIILLFNQSEHNTQTRERYKYINEEEKQYVLTLLRDKEISKNDIRDCRMLLNYIEL